MNPPREPVPDQRSVALRDVMRLYRAWARFGQDMVTRPLELALTSGGRAADDLTANLLGSWSRTAVASDLAREYATFLSGLLAVPGAAAASAAAQLDLPDPDPMGPWLGGGAPVETVTQVEVDHRIAQRQRHELARRAGFDGGEAQLRLPPAADAPFILPARVLDASQGWASWFIPAAAARKLMEESVHLGHQPQQVMQALEPLVVGSGDTLVTLLVSDYRVSDFGVTQEIALTLSVTPSGVGFPDPGQLFLRLIVTNPASLAAARQIWGIRKDFWDNRNAASARRRLEVAYTADRVRFGMGARLPKVSGKGFHLDFPRFGTGRSANVPAVVHSMAHPHANTSGPFLPARSMLIRSGSGEGMQFGGDVVLGLPETRAAGQAAGCLCSGGMACLCDTLRGLGLNARRPVANGWTERMSCTLGEPRMDADQSLGKSDA
jgi:hypothetical protein